MISDLTSTTRKWCATFAAIVASATCLSALVGYTVDCYGLFGDDVQGRKIVYHSNSGTSKFLLSRRYIPANFDGLLVGSSLSATWDLSGVRVARVYNASLNGANISDEKPIAENVLANGKLKLVLFCIHPFITGSHGQRVGDMTARTYWGALGSIQLAKEMGNTWAARFGLSHPLADEKGREAYPDHVAEFAAWQYTRPVEHKPVVTDEHAVAEYARLVAAARAHGARVLAFIPPIYGEKYEKQRAAFDAYYARMAKLFRPDEIIDLNAPRYAALTRERTTFYDDTHLTKPAVDFFSAELAAAVNARF